MAASEHEIAVQPPLLDRLIDLEPLSGDPQQTRAAAVRSLREALRRDLEWLLNTRRTPLDLTKSFEELPLSVFNYGLPDFSALSANAPKDRQKLLAELERTISLFEPRLRNVRVVLVEGSGVGTRMLRFQIEGSLQVDPSPEHISFDGELQLASGEYQLRGER